MIALIGQKLEHPSARKHESTEVDNDGAGTTTRTHCNQLVGSQLPV